MVIAAIRNNDFLALTDDVYPRRWPPGWKHWSPGVSPTCPSSLERGEQMKAMYSRWSG